MGAFARVLGPAVAVAVTAAASLARADEGAAPEIAPAPLPPPPSPAPEPAPLTSSASSAPRAAAPAGNAAEARLKGGHAGGRVLLAEDNEINCEIARTLLEDAGLVVDTAEDGAQAVELAGAGDYALILMDMQMPRMGGLEATREIRRMPRHARTPIMALTANAFAEDKARCLAAGMNDFIAKPVDPPVLFATMLRWLEPPSQ
jgi:CheY-like chemotaxis protein